MAIVLKFKQGDSGTELNLNAGETGFQLSGNGWNPAVATPVHMGDPAPIGESIHLLLAHTTHDNIAASMQSLHEMQVLSNRYIKDTTKGDAVWLHAKMANETGERRALVYSISVQYKTSWFGAPATALDIPLVITVVRGPYWESTSVRNLPDGAPSALACVAYDYTAAGDAVAAHDIAGDVGARLRYFETYGMTSIYGKFWMGMKSANRRGASSMTNFDPLWELEDGTSYTDCTDTGDATASGGNKVVVAESGLNWDDEWNFAANIAPSNVSGGTNEKDFLGSYLFLARAKVASGTWEIKARFVGYSDAAESYYEADPVEITNTVWRNKELGVNSIGVIDSHALIGADHVDDDNLAQTKIIISARRTSGSGNLDLDCIIAIPVDEGFCKITSTGAETDADFFKIYQSPEGGIQAMEASAGDSLISLVMVDAVNFTLPQGDGRIYIAYEALAGGDITDTIILNNGDSGRYYERWLSLRGSEGVDLSFDVSDDIEVDDTETVSIP